MWVELKDNFLDHQPNREFLWLFLGEIQAKNHFSCFCEFCISGLYALFFCGFCWGVFLPFLKTMCVTFSVAGFLMPLSLASERDSAAKMRTAKSVSASKHLTARYWGRKCIVSGTGMPTQLWNSQTHLFPVSYILGLTGSGGQPRAKAFELVPSGIACMKMRSLVAEPQASFFNCSELIPWSRSLCAAGNAGQCCL